MVRRACILATSRHYTSQAPNIHIMTEVKASHTLKAENYLLCECLYILKELLSCTQNDTLPPAVPTPEPLGFGSNPPLLVLPLQFKKLKINLPPEFHGKTTKYATFLDQYKFYFNDKPSIFLDNNKNKVFLIISHLRKYLTA